MEENKDTTPEELEENKDTTPEELEENKDTTAEEWEEIPMLCTTEGKVSKLESDVFGLLQSLVVAMCTIVILFTFVCPITRVSGDSMLPTLTHGETLLVWALLGYEPEINDVVIITDPTVSRLEGQSIVKRVIALGGQTVEIDYPNNQVKVDGSPLHEPYLSTEMLPIYGESHQIFTVPEDCIFVLGDNRNKSSDSRDPEIGMVNLGYVKGKVALGVWPMTSWRIF